MAGRRLTVTGERKERQRVGILRRRERVVGRFHYEVVLPADVEEDGVEAISTTACSPSACPSRCATDLGASRSAEWKSMGGPHGRPAHVEPSRPDGAGRRRREWDRTDEP